MNYMDIYNKPIIIFGCGNMLIGDDGFGPAVVQQLQDNYDIPDHVCVFDVGTGIREILFDLILQEKKPERIVVIDAMNVGRKPGEIIELTMDDLPTEKVSEFSLHQAPSANLLRELQEKFSVQVDIIVCQVEARPEEVNMKLSGPVARAVPEASKLIFERFLKLKETLNISRCHSEGGTTEESSDIT